MGLGEGWCIRTVLLWVRRGLYGLSGGLVDQDRAGMGQKRVVCA